MMGFDDNNMGFNAPIDDFSDLTPIEDLTVAPAEIPVAAVREEVSVSGQFNSSDPYAGMFADWDLMPPQMMINRIRRGKKTGGEDIL